MGRNLHYSIVKFLEKALNEHVMVRSWKRIDNGHYIYVVKRNKGLSDMVILASDEYRFLMDDYIRKPKEITQGSFILIARPEGDYADALVDIAKQDQISIGMFGALIGALYKEEHWNYVPKERRD